MNTRKHIMLYSLIAVVFLSCSGWLYHKSAAYLNVLSDVKVLPAIPLESFPYQFSSWEGVDLPLSETVIDVAGNDDYLSRVYSDEMRHLRAAVYVAFTAEPKNMLGHRPRRCYVGSGWTHDRTEEQSFVTPGGMKIPCLFHQFHKSNLNYQTIYVLNYYVVNGVLTSDHNDFSGLRMRAPKLGRGRLDYVAQVQISSVSEAAVEHLAREFSDEILRHFPPPPSK